MLKKCPFCSAPAVNHGGIAGNVRVDAVCCSKQGCIASFKRVSIEIWNTRAEVTPLLDTAEFELLMRRFCTASPGEPRAHAKQAVLGYVAKAMS